MKIKNWILGVVMLIAVAPFAAQAAPLTEVATISGCYGCVSYDTPTLTINNTTGGTLDNAQLVLKGYQGVNNGISQTINLGNLGDSTPLIWGYLPGVGGGLTAGNLAAGDYDDEYPEGTSNWIPSQNCESAGNPNTSGCVAGGGTYWYAQPGNFSVTFTATVSGGQYNGESVYSVFSPTSNATGSFNPWEGLNAQGFSEAPCCDVHSPSLTADLANIYLGAPPSPSVPEPGSLALAAIGIGLMALAIRRRNRTGDRIA